MDIRAAEISAILKEQIKTLTFPGNIPFLKTSLCRYRNN